MSKTYRGWGEIDDWSSGREFRRQHKRKSDVDSKQHIREELAEMEDEVTLAYVVVNEFVPDGSDVTVREDLYYTFDEQDAIDVLGELADQVGAALDMGESSFDAPPTAGLEENSYFVEEIEIHG